MRPVLFLISILLLLGSGFAAPKEHAIVLGKWHAVELRPDSGDAQQIKVRELIIDGKIREHTTGPLHEVTDRFFVLRRAIRLNDALPQETRNPQWIWRLTAWISIDRQTGRITPVNLPAFDADVSQASWYRDYAAYCGSSDDGSKSYMVISQMGKRKPILRKEYSGPVCAAPQWERSPSRVTFVAAGEKSSFVVHAHGADPQADPPEEDEGPQQ